MKWISYLILISCLLTSCAGSVDFSNPKAVVAQYYNLKFDGKFKLQYELIADTCKDYATAQEFSEYYTNIDSLSKNCDYFVLKIDQLPINPSYPKFRRFEIQFIEVKKEDKDTTNQVTYVTAYNESGKWKLIWSDNILKAAMNLQTSQKYAEAIQANNFVLKYDPLNGLAYRQIGMCQLRQGYYEKALRSVQKAKELNPLDVSLNYNLIAGIYLYQNNNELAVENFKEALEIVQNPDEKKSLLSNLAISYITLLKYNKAKLALNEALSIDSTYTHAWWQKGSLYETENSIDSAIICYKQAVSLESMDDYLQKQLYFDLANAEYKIIIDSKDNEHNRDVILTDAKKNILKAMDLQPDNRSYRKLLDEINRIK